MLSLPKIIITEKGERHVKGGHPWVFEGEVVRIDAVENGGPSNGELVHVFSQKDRFLGTGFYNANSKIRVRILSTNANDTFDKDFFRRRLKYALDYRVTVMGDDIRASRLIFGEADSFPGLTVDYFGDTLVVQTLSLGIEQRKDMILWNLVSLMREMGLPVRAVYERCDVAIRTLEGMEEFKGFWKPETFGIDPTKESGHTMLTENGILYDVDYVNGQKTGFFLDQKYNRLAAAKLAKGRRVLDCFTHTGAFALNCVKGGAEHVTAVDVSGLAIKQTKKNAALNGFTDKMSFLEADVFALLTDMLNRRSREYDYIILDPPAFTKSSSTVKDAFRGYKDINMRAMRCLPRGGYLATCSCSHFMKDSLFCQMLHDAAADAGVSLRQIEARAQSPDHPILWNVPETDYLKFYLFQVI